MNEHTKQRMIASAEAACLTLDEALENLAAVRGKDFAIVTEMLVKERAFMRVGLQALRIAGLAKGLAIETIKAGTAVSNFAIVAYVKRCQLSIDNLEEACDWADRLLDNCLNNAQTEYVKGKGIGNAPSA